MRIYGAGGTALAAKLGAARRTASGGFTVDDQESAHGTAQTGGLRSISTVDALLALQGIEDTTQKKKRAVAKGRRALDVLDGVKVALLDGTLDQSAVARLKVAAEGLSEESGDPGLDRVMSAINLRVAVELAKAGVQ
ncbi:MAG TPA: flagellar assembly protein FliX [Pseudolabrys sp.]|nr:flagellar assembly protein FliX [Pseudolabrys sp.]